MEKTIEVAQMIADILVPLSEQSRNKLASILMRTELRKNDVFLAEGEVCKVIGFVEKGMVRQYYYKNGKELTEYFAYEDKLFICIESCFFRRPSRMIVEALEHTVIYGILFEPFMEMIKTDEELAALYRRLLEGSLIISQRKTDSLRLESAHERYHRLMREDPEIIRRAPLSDIASYLLMTPETLSRVRANLNG